MSVAVAPAQDARSEEEVRTNEKLHRWVARAASWLLFLGGWQILGTYIVEPFILPPPSIVAPEMVEVIRSGELLRHFGASLTKLAQSFPIFFLLGACVGTLMALNRWWEDFLRDAVSVASSLPGLVYILVLLLIFGTSGLAPIGAIVLAVTPFIVFQFWEGVKGVSTELLQMASAFKLSRAGVLRHVVIPALTPFILTAITHGVSIGWRLVVLTELFGGSSGIGFKMRAEFSHFAVRGVVAWALFFFVFSLIFDRLLFAPISKWVLRWRED
ncbi:MAG: ABC transporter permease subunit [Chloroflexi bacterium]|nr:ABC transporter permease subunit [Chloroflexota bacterium]